MHDPGASVAPSGTGVPSGFGPSATAPSAMLASALAVASMAPSPLDASASPIDTSPLAGPSCLPKGDASEFPPEPIDTSTPPSPLSPTPLDFPLLPHEQKTVAAATALIAPLRRYMISRLPESHAREGAWTRSQQRWNRSTIRSFTRPNVVERRHDPLGGPMPGRQPCPFERRRLAAMCSD